MAYRKRGSIAQERAMTVTRCIERAKGKNWILVGLSNDAAFSYVELTCDLEHTFRLQTRGFLYKDRQCPFCAGKGIYNREDAAAALRKVNLVPLNTPQLDTDMAIVQCGLCKVRLEVPFGKLRRKAVRCVCRRSIDSRMENQRNLQNYVESKGGKLLDSRPVLQKEKVSVRCSNGHEWMSQAGSLLLQKTWCPKCAGNAPRSLAELEKIVTARGGKLLTTEYKGVDGSYEFLCNLGHHNRNMFKKIEKGQWCPTCNRHSKSEEITRTILENLFNTKFPKKRPTWLRNTRGRLMELDGFSEDLAIAFEYQGAQHFEESTLYRHDLTQRRLDDSTKAQLCKENGVTLLIFTYLEEFEDFHRIAQAQLKEAGRDIVCDFDDPVNFESAFIREDRLVELKKLLAPKRIRVLSTKWTKVDSFYEFECQVCGSRYKARANSYFNSRRVAGCNYCARRTPGNKKNIESLRGFALRHNGELLSEVYVRRNHTYTWKCGAGHVFQANFNNLASRNVFCNECENRQSKEFITQTEATDLFSGYGFDLIGEYSGRTRYAKTKCQVCGFEGSQILSKLRAGGGKCKGCIEASREAEARTLLEQVGVSPIAPYPGIYEPWLCKCAKCSNEISPSIWNIQRGQGPCKFCSRASKKN